MKKHYCPDCKQEIFPQVYSKNTAWLVAVCKNLEHKQPVTVFLKNEKEKNKQ